MTEEMAQWVRVYTAFPEDLSLGPSTHVTIASNSSSRGSDALFCSAQALNSSAHKRINPLLFLMLTKTYVTMVMVATSQQWLYDKFLQKYTLVKPQADEGLRCFLLLLTSSFAATKILKHLH